MSKDLNQEYIEAVENVDKIVDYCISTLEFWKCSEMWPMNLVTEGLKAAHESMKFIKLLEYNKNI